jgi:hypothetical protein
MSRSNNQEAFPQLETKRLILREMRSEDAKAIFHFFGDEDDLPPVKWSGRMWKGSS